MTVEWRSQQRERCTSSLFLLTFRNDVVCGEAAEIPSNDGSAMCTVLANASWNSKVKNQMHGSQHIPANAGSPAFPQHGRQRSFGGGRGSFRNLEGDVPLCMGRTTFERRHAETYPNEAEMQVEELICVTKNLMSMRNEDRETVVFEELDTFPWHIAFLTETWRPDKAEKWERDDEQAAKKHLFLGSGGDTGRNGVAIVVHADVKKRLTSWKMINDRVCTADLHFTGHRIRAISVYMSCGKYSDEEVNKVYRTLEKAVKMARVVD